MRAELLLQNIFLCSGPSTTTACTTVKLVTKNYGKENSWALGSCESTAKLGGSQEYGDNSEYTQECCQQPGTYELECKDTSTYKDGWHGGYIEIQGQKYCDDSWSGSEKKDQVTITGNNPIPYQK